MTSAIRPIDVLLQRAGVSFPSYTIYGPSANRVLPHSNW